MSAISIITPIYFYNDFVEKMLLSLVNQTDNDIELVLVGNNITEEQFHSFVVQAKHLIANSSIRLVEVFTLVRGANYSRRLGYQHSSGDYVYFLDSDDQLAHTDVIRELKQVVASQSPDMICTNLQHAVITGKETIKGQVIYRYLQSDRLLQYSETPLPVIQNYGSNIGGRLIRRQLLENVTFFDVPFFQDWNISSKTFSQVNSIYFIQRPCYLWVKRGDSISQFKNMTKQDLDKSFESLLDIKSHYETNGLVAKYQMFLDVVYTKFCINYLLRSEYFSIDEGFKKCSTFLKANVSFRLWFLKDIKFAAFYFCATNKVAYKLLMGLRNKVR